MDLILPTWLIGIGIVGGFSIWKFIIQPRMNEGNPIEPEADYKTFGEQMDESMKTNIDPECKI